MESRGGRRGNFQISNNTAGKLHSDKTGGRKDKQVRSDTYLVDFIFSHQNLVDEEVIERVRRREGVAINDALNQIHWRSLKVRDNVDGKGLPAVLFQGVRMQVSKSYSQVVKELNSERKKETEWKVVSYKGRSSKTVPIQECIIFISNIPQSTSTRDLWDFFKMGGVIKDIILPKKRDIRNKRYGFVKTCSELEAGWIILNLKQFKGLGHVLKMKINESKEFTRIRAKDNDMDLNSGMGSYSKVPGVAQQNNKDIP